MPTKTTHQDLFQELSELIDRQALFSPSVDLERFSREEKLHPPPGAERRRHRRYSLITNVIGVPLDDRLRPISQPFIALSSGMSVSGIRLIHTDPLPSDYLFIEIDGQPVRFVLSVLRSRPIGPCVEIAGQFLDRTLVEISAGLAARPTNSDSLLPLPAEPSSVCHIAPTADELSLWAGVTAAVQFLSSR